MNEVLLRQARALHQAGDLDGAARVYREIIATNPRSTEALLAHASVMEAQGRHDEAVKHYDAALALDPRLPAVWNNRGNSLLALKRFDEAIVSYRRAIALAPDFAQAWHHCAIARIMAGRHAEALGDLEKTVAIEPDYAQAWEHRGYALAMLGRFPEAVSSYSAALALRPKDCELMLRRAELYLHSERFTEALSDYDQVLALEPDRPEIWHNRGIALSRLARYEDAFASYDRALALNPRFAEAWCNRANTHLDMKNYAGAISNYSTAIGIEPNYPLAWRGRGIARMAEQRYAEALADFEHMLASNPSNADAWEQRGNALSRLSRQGEALESYFRAAALGARGADLLFNRASTLAALKRFGEAAEDCEALLAASPDYPYARGLFLLCKQQCCDWRGIEEDRAKIAAGLHLGKAVIRPFAYLALSSDLGAQLECTRIEVANFCPPAPQPLWRGDIYRHGRIRVAYLSANYYSHAISFLAAGLFENHNRNRFEVTAISISPDDGSATRARLLSAFDRFIDVRDKTDVEAAEQLRAMEIDIAVDVTGYTDGARPGILARRPAPVQVNFLAYPGTMGAPYIDYLIADRIVVPSEHAFAYSEAIVHLPDTYQCNDSKRKIAEHIPTRGECGLPETGFVFCCFNANNKLAPDIFDIWMRLLKRVEGSVLWLFQGTQEASRNLRREAAARKVSPERLIFAQSKPLDEHLARLKCADLFLDTLPYGAHTTASDALWVELPVLTVLGESFAGRVAASLLTAVDLPELIAADLSAYEKLAYELAHEPLRLAIIKEKLLRNRGTEPLFDTVRFTRHLESAYIAMWERYQRSEPPGSFAVNQEGGRESR